MNKKTFFIILGGKVNKHKDDIIYGAIMISVVVASLIFFGVAVSNVKKERQLQQECAYILADRYNINNYAYSIEEIKDDIVSDDIDAFYIVKVYNGSSYIEALMSVNKEKKIRIEKIITLEK